MSTCITPVGCTTACLFTGKPCTRFGQTFASLLHIEPWFGATRGRKTLWRAVNGEWVEVATSTSARVLADRFTAGVHVIMPVGVAPTMDAPLSPVAGALF